MLCKPCLYANLKTVSACRKAVLPLINKRWACVLRGPSQAWRDVWLRSARIEDDEGSRSTSRAAQPLNSAAVLAWFTSRSG